MICCKTKQWGNSLGVIIPKEVVKEILGNFMDAWITFEKAVMNLSLPFGERPRIPIDAIRLLHKEGLISRSEMTEIDHLRTIRNEIIHGMADYNSVLNSTMVDRLNELTKKMSQTNE